MQRGRRISESWTDPNAGPPLGAFSTRSTATVQFFLDRDSVVRYAFSEIGQERPHRLRLLRQLGHPITHRCVPTVERKKHKRLKE